MEKNDKRDYGQEAHNPPKQKLSYFNNHVNKYPDSAKHEETPTDYTPNLDTENFDEGDYEDIDDNIPDAEGEIRNPSEDESQLSLEI